MFTVNLNLQIIEGELLINSLKLHRKEIKLREIIKIKKKLKEKFRKNSGDILLRKLRFNMIHSSLVTLKIRLQ